MPVVDDERALLSGSYWNGIEVTGRPVIVTFSFPSSLPAYDASIDGFTLDTVDSFQAFTEIQQAQALQALGEWADASGLIFVQVAPGQGDINFSLVDFDTTSAPSYAGAGGIGFYPFGNWDGASYPNYFDDLDASGEVFMNSKFVALDGTVAYGTLLHEIGHAIGLKHPTEVVDNSGLPPDGKVHNETLSTDDPTRTIMATIGDGTPEDEHLRDLDKDAAAFIYGAAGSGDVVIASTSGSNSVSTWSWNEATQTLTQIAAGTNATIRGTSVNDLIQGTDGDDRLFGLAGNDLLTGGKGKDELFGGSGVDTLVGGADDDTYYVSSATTTIVEKSSEGIDAVYSTVSLTMSANLEKLTLYGEGLTGIGNDTGVEMIGAGDFSTVLIGGAGEDEITGGLAADTLQGNGGPDLLWGGGGGDTFVFKALADAPLGGTLTTIGDFVSSDNDKIDLSALKTTGSNPGQSLTFVGTAGFTGTAGEVREFTVFDTNTIVEGDIDGDGNADFQIQLYGLHTLQSSDFLFEAPCYRAGTRILTDHGEVAVQALAIGDHVVTADGATRPIAWIGHRTLDCQRHPDPRRVWPVLVRAEAFGDGMPHRDLWLSPDHAVFVSDVLIPIRHLINGMTITQMPVDEVSYYHVELAQHDLLIAEGLPAESYLDTGNRGRFANAAGPISLHPTFDEPRTWRDDACAPLASDEARVRPVWERLVRRAQSLGFTLAEPSFTDDPSVHLLVDGHIVAPVVAGRDCLEFVLPRRGGRLVLASRAARPTDERPWLDDGRPLGVYVSRIVVHQEHGVTELPVDHPVLREGWWAVEHAGTALRRWTDGQAVLPVVPEAALLKVHLAGSRLRYLSPAAQSHTGGVQDSGLAA